MKKIILLLFLFTFSFIYTQNFSINYIDKIVTKTNYLKNTNKLKFASINDSKTCGGNLTGYYRNEQLVLVISYGGGEYSNNEIKYYIKENEILKIDYIEKYADENYLKKLGADEIAEFNQVRKIIAYMTPKITVKKSSQKLNESITTINLIIECGDKMIKQLNDKNSQQ